MVGKMKTIQQRTKALCRHCQRLLTMQARGLCKTCFNDRIVRSLYPPARETRRGIAAMDKSLLHQPRPERCEHERRDGECPECERKQRALLRQALGIRH